MKRRLTLDPAIPTINIVFLLLLFFLVAGRVRGTDEVGVDMPQSLQTAADRLPKPLLIVTRSGDLRMDGRPISVEALADRLRAATPQPGTLTILADGAADARAVLALAEQVEAASDLPVRLAALPRRVTGVPP